VDLVCVDDTSHQQLSAHGLRQRPSDLLCKEWNGADTLFR
jgi:hypothetical protein